jgi:aminobenzoyl-glutamate utilization protein B
MNVKDRIASYLEEHKDVYFDLSDQIWDFAETAYQEVRSSTLQADFLEQNGFAVQRGIADIPTAFVAEFRSGEAGEGPVIGLAGEYDALTNMSQKADVTAQDPIIEGGGGHACGHHLLGVACMASAMALKHMLEEKKIPGTIRYYGCPAEETYAGKAFMVRAGVFNDLDIAISWHPQSFNSVAATGSLANIRMRYRFTGISANPAHSAHLGRSALDAAELMNVGANYLREHMTTDARVHYAYEDAGGKAANVMPSKVEVNYGIRAAKMSSVIALKERVDKLARGAALMMETQVTSRMISAYADYVSNSVVEKALEQNLQAFLPVAYTEEELAYARRFREVTGQANIDTVENRLLKHSALSAEEIMAELEQPVSNLLLSRVPFDGSTDFADISHIVPGGQLFTTCFTQGIPPHAWQAAAQGKSGIAHKGELLAAKAMAGAAWDFFISPALVEAAKAELAVYASRNPYSSPLPPDALPGL